MKNAIPAYINTQGGHEPRKPPSGDDDDDDDDTGMLFLAVLPVDADCHEDDPAFLGVQPH